MKSFRFALLIAILAVAPLALSACMGDDNGENEDEITEAIERAATSGDPAACTEVQTQKFLEQTTGGEGGAEAVKQCEQEAADTVADEVSVENIELDGDTATAEAAVTGSFFDGQTLELALVKEDDTWKLDEFVGFVDFDRAKFVETFVTGLQEEEGGAPPEAINCIRAEFDNASDEDLQSLVIEDKPTFDPFSACFGDEGGGGGAEDEGTATEPEGTATEEETTTP